MYYVEDITSPLDAYRDCFRQDNADVTNAVLDELVKQSGIDEQSNGILCKEIYDLEKQILHCDKKKRPRYSCGHI